MAAPPSSQLQTMLQAAVQSVQWTYSLFWQLCPQQGILVWADGYYNGAIKTRKTVQPMEVSSEEASLQRSQQLRELYDSLSAGETNQPARRPCAALSPEDLTESEWFYLMCVSFSFPPGVGLPGKAYARRQHVWLTGANDVDSKTFSRAILAKSARVQTVVCIPMMDGVVEFGTIDKVQEGLGFVQHVKSFFTDHPHQPLPPKPALSEHSTSNPATSSDHPHFHYSPLSVPPIYPSISDQPPVNASLQELLVHPEDQDLEDQEEEEDDDDDEEIDDGESDSEAETGRNNRPIISASNVLRGMATTTSAATAEPSELVQLEMSEDIRLGSPEDGSNNLDSDFHMLAVSQSVNPTNHNQRHADSYRANSSTRRIWPLGSGIQPPHSGAPAILDDLAQEDTHYSLTVSTVLQTQPIFWAATESSSISYIPCSTHSAFAKWTNRTDHHFHTPPEGTSQWLLKYILFSIPVLHSKYHEENSPKLRDGTDATTRFKKGTPQDELSANHVLAERRRREKLNERFIILRSLVPFVTKMDKASILGDTIEYLKQLREKIQDLEARNRQMEVDHQRSRLGDFHRSNSLGDLRKSSSLKEQRCGGAMSMDRAGMETDQIRVGQSGQDKRKLRIVEESSGGVKPKMVVESPPPPSPTLIETSIEVSIIESDALLELQCPYKEGLLLDIMQLLRELRIETTTVQSSLTNGFFVAELRAKVIKENVNGRKARIMEVKRAINQVIPHTD